MPAYVIALIQTIADPDTYKRYVAQVEATLAPFGGRFIARKPEPDALEGGSAPARAVIMEFPSEEQARAWHASPGYKPVMELRQSASKGTLLLLPGYGSAPAPRVPMNEVCYVEMVAADVEATVRFCEDVFGWAFRPADADLGGSRVATLPSGTRCAVRGPLNDEEEPLTRAYVRVANAESAVARAQRHGATLALPPTQLGPHGTIAIWFVQGVQQGVWQLP